MKKYKSKKSIERIIADTEIIEIIEQKQYANGRIKNVFKCKSDVATDGRMCILWGLSSIRAGAKIRMAGNLILSGGKEIFLAHSSIVDKI